MRDFEKDIASASRFRKVLPETEFSWSLSRHRLFHFCKRACFLHYYLAQGGWDVYADPLVREVYSLKKLLPLKLHLSGIFEDSLSEALLRTRGISGPPVEKKKLLLGLLLRSLSRKASGAFPGRADSSSGSGEEGGTGIHWNLLEHFYGVRGFSTAEAVHRRIRESLGKAWRFLGASPLADELSGLTENDLLFCSRIAAFRYGSCRVWFHPGTVWFRKNTAFALRCDFPGAENSAAPRRRQASRSCACSGSPPCQEESAEQEKEHLLLKGGKKIPSGGKDTDTGMPAEEAENSSEDAALFALYAKERWKSESVVFRILRFPGEGEGEEEGECGVLEEVTPCTGIGEIIRDSVREMLRPLRKDGTFDIADFPPAEEHGDRTRCTFCRFRQICRKIRSAAAEQQEGKP